MGIRPCHPKICHFGIRSILSWRHLKTNRHRKTFLLSLNCLKAGHTFPLRRCPSLLYQEKESSSYHWRWKRVCTNEPYYNYPSLLIVAPTPPMYFLATSPWSPNPPLSLKMINKPKSNHVFHFFLWTLSKKIFFYFFTCGISISSKSALKYGTPLLT